MTSDELSNSMAGLCAEEIQHVIIEYTIIKIDFILFHSPLSQG